LRKACTTLAFTLVAAAGLASAPAASATPPPAAARARVAPYRVGGRPPLVLVHQRVDFRGYVTPYVAGQSVEVTLARRGRAVERLRSRVAADGARGRFTVSFVPRVGGELKVVARHAATSGQVAFSATSRPLHVVWPDLPPGSRAQSVRVLQSELAAMHFAVPDNGALGPATGRALIAYRKALGLPRIPAAGRRVFEALERGAGFFRVHDPRAGRHIEANLALELLAEVEPGGRVRRVYTMSSGKPSTPTVLGHFRVYRREPGVNSEGMVDSSYFIRGYAIHGYPEVPTYAASHGCLRVPIPDAPAIYAWIRLGTPVDVYY